MHQTRYRLFGYSLTILLSSGILMALEIIAGRLIAPYVGVSLYTWTSIIGVVLAGLSLGNWVGGILADRKPDSSLAGYTLALSGITSLSVLLILSVIAPILGNTQLNLVSITFLFVSMLFFVPATLLGVITPLLVTLALRMDKRTGHIIGRMHALAAIGSILGTFVTGFWLIQYFGTRTILVACSVILFAMSIFFLWPSRKTVIATLAGMLSVWYVTQSMGGHLNPCDRESQYYCIRLVDASDSAPAGNARAMILDHLLHSTNHRENPTLLITPYVHLMDEIIYQQFGDETSAKSFFFAGGGAYTHPRAIQAAYPGAQITVAELDPAVTRFARDHLWVSTQGMKIYHEDARYTLSRSRTEKYDVIIGDVFHDISVPYHLITLEYYQLVHGKLAENGLFIMNVVDRYPDPLLVKSVLKTLATIFPSVEVWHEETTAHQDRKTYIIEARNTPRMAEELLTSSRGFSRRWQRITPDLQHKDTPLANLPLLTDDFVPVERLVQNLLLESKSRKD